MEKDMDYRKEIRAYLEAHKEELVSDICELMKIDSERGEAAEGRPFGEGPYEGLMAGARVLEKNGFVVNNCDNYCIDTVLNGKELQLDILCHLDVVPAGDGWRITEPFSPLVQDGKIFGRGSSDDKGPAMAALYAMKAVRDLGIPLEKDVRLILGSDEECGSSDIAYYFGKKAHAPMSISPDADFPLIFLEKGSLHTTFTASFERESALPRVTALRSGIKVNVVPAAAEAEIEGLTVEMLAPCAAAAEARTGVRMTLHELENGRVLVQAAGLGAHAAGPMDGNNALTALLSFLSGLELADTPSSSLLRKISALFPHGDFYGKALGVAREDEISGKLTLTLDLFSMDEKGLSGTFDCRSCVSANDENTKDVIFKRLEEAGLQHDNDPMNPPHYVPRDSVLVQTLLASYEKITGKKEEPLAIGGGTYVHHIENGVACGCADPAVDNHMHGPDEFVIIEQLLMSAEIYADAIIALCSHR